MSRSENKISIGHCTEFCQAVRGIGAFNGEVPSHDELRSALGLDADGYLLGTLGELQKRKGCPFCQIILEALNEAVLASAVKESGLEAPRAEPVRITVRPGEHCLRLSHPLLCGTRVLFVENGTEKINSEQGPYVARVVKEEQVSTWLVRSWLRQCEEKHGDSCFHLPLSLRDIEFTPIPSNVMPTEVRGIEHKTLSINEEKTSNFRLLDLGTKCVRYMPLGTRYVTLSYVRDQAPVFELLQCNLDFLQTPGALDKIGPELPRTITDAMELVRSLGERYLWVDALCLVQDHPRDMKGGIEMMNSILRGSHFAIVAASGTGVQSGIPGVRPGSRQPSQHIAQLNSKMKIAVTHSMYWYLQNSTYNQQGWTLQELVLPRRSLIFINNQAYFRCTQANWCEETAADLQGKWEDPDDDCILPIASPGTGNLVAWDVYQNLCEDYSDRTLEHDGDALRALSGILRQLGGELTSWYADGLPANYLNSALLFLSMDGKLRRRPGFASYSWAGWSGPIAWAPETRQGPDHNSQAAERLFHWVQRRTFIQWHVWTRKGSVNEVDNVDEYNEPRRIERFTDRYAHALADETVQFLRQSQYLQNSFLLARYSAWSLAFPLPCFTQGKRYGQEIGGGGIYSDDVINSQAEVDWWAYHIKHDMAWLILISWVTYRASKARNCKARELSGPTTVRREGDELDYEFRDTPASEVREIVADDDDEPFDARVRDAKRAIESIRLEHKGSVPNLPKFPIYPVILFKALSIRLITGPPPALEPKQDISSKALPRHKRPLQWVKGSPLFASDGELVGSLHVDNIASHTAGIEVECLIIAYSKEPIAGSALPKSQVPVGDDDDWNLFWVMHVVEKDGIYERRGVGQVLDSVLTKSCVRSEDKVILLG
ncbi:HET domain-containing protein [Fusarium keratoplasticum]|uniref:HET domain-containing protein n=1 Tax=Fusarium keratoplasticum TaxID=1328300 RepID=A0ACC0RFT0_9HYPO|nr:HET domain-containing protein [Fusarium keratoplasticum]KAI8685123.1 HET domain-containing protein [Fusarium keratoplasticum]KAI8689243.1 HET domain-containing protein [Fusarium keratoplasticum]